MQTKKRPEALRLSRRAVLAGLAAAPAFAIARRASAEEALRVAEVVTGAERAVLASMAEAGLDAAHGFRLVTRAFGSEDEARRALSGGEVDLVMTDWLWAARRRADGSDIACAPAHLAPQKLMARADGPVAAIADLVDRRVGIARDSGQSGWAMVKAVALSASRIDLDLSARTFGPGPTLAAKLRAGELDALLADWPEAALLSTEGFVPLVASDGLARALGIKGRPPGAVWAFRDGLATRRPDLLAGFLAAGRAAWDRLAGDSRASARLAALHPGAGDAGLAALRAAMSEGRLERWGAAEAARVDELSRRLGEILGRAYPGALPRGLFRDDLTF